MAIILKMDFHGIWSYEGHVKVLFDQLSCTVYCAVEFCVWVGTHHKNEWKPFAARHCWLYLHHWLACSTSKRFLESFASLLGGRFISFTPKLISVALKMFWICSLWLVVYFFNEHLKPRCLICIGVRSEIRMDKPARFSDSVYLQNPLSPFWTAFDPKLHFHFILVFIQKV